jgi:hypothetical protein
MVTKIAYFVLQNVHYIKFLKCFIFIDTVHQGQLVHIYSVHAFFSFIEQVFPAL